MCNISITELKVYPTSTEKNYIPQRAERKKMCAENYVNDYRRLVDFGWREVDFGFCM